MTKAFDCELDTRELLRNPEAMLEFEQMAGKDRHLRGVLHHLRNGRIEVAETMYDFLYRRAVRQGDTDKRQKMERLRKPAFLKVQ